MTDYATARRNMVDNQIRANKVTDPGILRAFGSIPRERFVPEPLRGIAYADEDLHLGDGRYLTEPMVLARLLQSAAPEPGDVALDIGSGSGYSTAILSRVVSSVIATEPDGRLVDAGNQRLTELEIDNAAIIKGPLRDGNVQQQPYDVILIAGGVQEIPGALTAQLREGGRLVTVLYDEDRRIGRAVVVHRLDGEFFRRIVFDAATPLLPGFELTPSFVF